jgi:WD40 repeat protein
MASDGKSFITAVGSRDSTSWIHDKDGDQPISSQGNVSAATFSVDGKSLYYLLSNGQSPASELWLRDLATGKTERILSSISSRSYSVSSDGKQVVYASNDPNGNSSVWIAPTNRRSSSLRISPPGATDDLPQFLPNGDIVFRSIEGGLNFLNRMKSDGSERRRIISKPVVDVNAVSPDGRWVISGSAGSNPEQNWDTRIFPVDGGEPVTLCKGYCLMIWDTSGKFAYLNYKEADAKQEVYVVPVQSNGLPKLPPHGIANKEDLTNANFAAIPHSLESAVNPSLYTYTVQNTRRNLFRVPLQ